MTQLISLTENAASQIKQIMAQAPADEKIIGIRVGVTASGCSGMSYSLAYATEGSPMDVLVEDKGVSILVKADAVLFLLGSEIDYETTRLSSKFVFRNPNQTDACGCGESVTIVPAKEDV